MAARTIKVDYLARIEGEAAFKVVVRDGVVRSAAFSVFEPPRFFEALLRGRAFGEAPDITSRICGICPIAYQMSAVHAMESALGVAVTGPLRELRRLIYCGEWIESHTLHVYLLHAPDFLGYASGIHLARDHPEIVQRGLRMKKAGNRLIEVIGGRSVHPVNVRVGGFYRAPDPHDLRGLAGELEWGRRAALDTVAWVAAFDFPDFTRDYEYVSLRDPAGYPVMGDRIASSGGLDIPARDYDANFTELQVPHSTALHSVLDGNRTYLTGPMARYSLNSGYLPEAAASAARAAGLDGTCDNPFRSIVVRAVELVYAFDEALRLIEGYEPPEPPSVDVPPVAATGYGCTEAPRGLLYHRYRITADGTIADAKIVPPTSQNLRVIEADLREFAGPRLGLPHDQLTWQCEQAVRSHDPCISCATHFLDLRVVNGSRSVQQLDG
jgi:coenzyme F420-reducing hydrogenase alpha subunit